MNNHPKAVEDEGVERKCITPHEETKCYYVDDGVACFCNTDDCNSAAGVKAALAVNAAAAAVAKYFA